MIDPKFSSKKEFSLYNDTIKLIFNPSYHRYNIDGKDVVGVTTVLNQLNKPALVQWSANETVKFLQEKVEAGKNYDEVQLAEFFKEAKFAYRRKSEKAADFGTMVHKWIEDHIAGRKPTMPVNIEMKQAVDSFLEWEIRNKVVFTSNEKVVYSKKYNYAGTCDFTCEIEKKKYVGDLKTSKGIYDEYLLQVAAYRYALQEEYDTKYDGMIIVRIPKVEGDVIEIKYFNDYVENAKCFIYLLHVWHNMQRIKNITNNTKGVDK